MKTFERLDEEYHASPKSAIVAKNIALLALELAILKGYAPEDIALWSQRYKAAGGDLQISVPAE